jgi:hypothetical protein
MARIAFINGDEQDVLGRAGKTARKHYNTWDRPGKTAAVKRSYRRRERRIGKAETAAY